MSATFDVLANDVDPGDTLKVIQFTQPGLGIVLQDPLGGFTYNPLPNVSGSDAFTYVVRDLFGATSIGTVFINIIATNHAPVAVADSATSAIDTPVDIAVLANDTDADGDALTAVSVTTPAHGTATINANFSVRYTPASGFSGADTFTYTISDTHGGTSSAAVSITITAQSEAERANQIRSDLNAGLDAFYLRLPELGESFNAPDLPVLPGDLTTTLGVANTLSAERAPPIPVQSSIAGLIGSLEGLGFEILAINGGFTDASHNIANTSQAGDLILLRYRRDIAHLTGSSSFDKSTLGLLSGLAPTADLSGSVAWDGDLGFDLNIGVDASGFFLRGDSNLTLAITGGGTIDGSFPLVGSLAIAGSGTAGTGADGITISLHGDTASQRYRASEFAGQFLAPHSNGSALIALNFNLLPINLPWTGTWTLNVADNVTTTQADVQFPCTDDLINALLPLFTDSLGSVLSSEGLTTLVNGLQLPLTSGQPLGPAADPGASLVRSSEFQSHNWFLGLYDWLNNLFHFDLVRGDLGQFETLGHGVHYTVGDEILGSDRLRNELGLTGKGVKIGVISDGVHGYAEMVDGKLEPGLAVRGDNPDITPDSVQIFNKFIGGPLKGKNYVVLDKNGNPVPVTGGGAEGTAMIEIIQDIAPDAEIYFVAVGGKTDDGKDVDSKALFKAGLDWMVANGIQIIVDDLGFYSESFFQTDATQPNAFFLEDRSVADKVKEIVDAGKILYVSAAGNDNLGHYQGPLTPHRDTVAPPSKSTAFYQLFGDNTDFVNVEVAASQTVEVMVQSSERVVNPDFALRLVLVPPVGDPLEKSGGNEEGLTTLQYTNSSDHNIIVKVYIGIDITNLITQDSQPVGPTVEMIVTNGVLRTYNTPTDAIVGHPAVSGVLTVGAIDVTDWQDPDYTVPEPFSSRGPSTILDIATGALVEVRGTLDVMATDNVHVSGAGGFPSLFPGTSAAAPHVAAIAALLMQARPFLSATGIREAIITTAKDLTLSPIVVNDAVEGVEDLNGQIIINPQQLLVNDLDPGALLSIGAPRSPLRIVSVSPNQNTDGKDVTTGKVELRSGVIYYTPIPGSSLDSFRYTVESADSDQSAGIVTIAIGPAGSTPLGITDLAVASLIGPTPINPLEHALHVDGAILNINKSLLDPLVRNLVNPVDGNIVFKAGDTEAEAIRNLAGLNFDTLRGNDFFVVPISFQVVLNGQTLQRTMEILD